MKKITYLLLLLLTIFALQSCIDDPSVNATRLRIHLTDAPLQTSTENDVIHEFHVDIAKIEVLTTDGEGQEWVSLDYKGGHYNLLPLTNGKMEQIYDAYFPAGNLLKMKVYYGDNSYLVVNKDKTERKVHLDGVYQDGVIYDVSTALYAHNISNIIIDINAALSLYQEEGNYHFHPQARAFASTYGGTLKGKAGPAEALPAVFVLNETDTLLTFPEPADGMFQILGLSEGVWDIYIFSRLGELFTDTIFSDTIHSGKTLDLPTITLKPIEEPGEPDPENPDPETPSE